MHTQGLVSGYALVPGVNTHAAGGLTVAASRLTLQSLTTAYVAANFLVPVTHPACHCRLFLQHTIKTTHILWASSHRKCVEASTTKMAWPRERTAIVCISAARQLTGPSVGG
jgi:hypothetical protein